MARLGTIVSTHRGLCALLVGHALVFWWVVGSGTPWATGPVECAAGTMSEVALGRIDWPVLDTFDGALGGMFVAGMLATPLFLVGAGGLGIKLVAWAFAVAVLLVVYRLIDAYAVGESRRFAALAAAAGLAFGPPALLHPQVVFGNWHWTELVFDYGLVLVAFELLRRERAGGAGPVGWLAFGGLSGLAIFNSIGSLPFVAVAWGGLALALPRAIGTRAVGRFAAATAAACIGALPFLVKLAHTPFGRAVPTDQTVGRLSRIAVEPGRIFQLMGEELAWALHLHDVLPHLGNRALVLAGVWVGVCWFGLALAAVVAVRRRRPVVAVPVVFAALFCGALLLIDTPLDVVPVPFSNIRGVSARVVPPLLAALVVGAALGWTALGDTLGVGSTGRLVTRLLALVPCAIGLAGISAIPSRAAGDAGEPAAYRASCMDVTAFFASKHFRDAPQELRARCSALEPEVGRACAAGAAWGAGYYALAFSGTGPEGWDPRMPALDPAAAEPCAELPSPTRERCLLGLGWAVGQRDWGRERWPLTSCSSLEPADRGPCWRGVGFHLGDHVAYTPERIGQLVARVPARWRADVARGAGYSMGRTWADPAVPRSLCAEAGPLVERGCVLGIDDALTDR